VVDGQTIGVGAGQQSRIHCVRLAGQKADLWRLRQHPHVMALPFRPEIKRAERDNAIDQFLRDDVTLNESRLGVFTSPPRQLARKKARLARCLTGVSCGSDAFPLPRQHRSRRRHRGKYVLEPAAHRDDIVIRPPTSTP
jgi:phosphoribosylaminoimidazolecarboxamide formyltransferase/IMP cyclohydrolase